MIRLRVVALVGLAAALTVPHAALATASPRPEALENVGATTGKEAGAVSMFSHTSGSSITSSGPLTEIQVSADLNCAVNNADDAFGAFYGDTACATLIVVDGTLYGPATIPAGLVPDAAFTPVSQTPVTGSGSASDPYAITTVVDAGSSGIRLTQTDTYVAGEDNYRTAVEVGNAGPNAAAVILYRAGDCYLADSDFGFGDVVATSGAVACISSEDGGLTPGTRRLEWQPFTAGSSHMQARYWEIWQHIETKAPFPNSTRASEYIDSGAGLSWQLSVPAAGSATAAHATTVSGGPAAPSLIFVHGFRGSFADLGGFQTFVDNLSAVYPGRIDAFQHFQDRGYREPDGTCANPRPLPSVNEPNGGMPVDLEGSDPAQYCDSQGDLALNAVALHQDVVAAYDATGEPVVLVANSMGAAIVRGFLSYSAELGDGVAANYVNSVIFLQGAHDGSWGAAPLATGFDSLAFIGEFVGGVGHAGLVDLDRSRPALHDLADRSDWYSWANPGAARLPNLPYYNMYGDLDVVVVGCFLFAGCEELERYSWGDTVMLAGTDDPLDVPAGGGARFLPGGVLGADRWQWRLAGEVVVASGPFWAVAGLPELYNHPIAHGNFGDNLAGIITSDCASGQPVSAHDALLSVIHTRMNADPSGCQP